MHRMTETIWTGKTTQHRPSVLLNILRLMSLTNADNNMNYLEKQNDITASYLFQRSRKASGNHV